jgi:hypothetical protein
VEYPVVRKEIEATILKYGEPVELTPQKPGSATVFLTALVQSPLTNALVNEFDTTSFIVYIRAGDLAVPPVQFDRLKIRGITRAIEEVHTETLSGATLVYIARVRG